VPTNRFSLEDNMTTAAFSGRRATADWKVSILLLLLLFLTPNTYGQMNTADDEPIRVKQGERVLFHILNASATEIRSLALPGHSFQVVALDGNAVPSPQHVPVPWIGTAERISAVVEMNQPGVWILGDLSNDDRGHGMGIVVEYADRPGKAQWVAPPPFRWSYLCFAKPAVSAPSPDETIEMTFAKENAPDEGFNRWTINGIAFPMEAMSGSCEIAQRGLL